MFDVNSMLKRQRVKEQGQMVCTVVAGVVDTSALAKLTLLRSGSGSGGFRARQGGLDRSGHAGVAWGWVLMGCDGLWMNVDGF